MHRPHQTLELEGDDGGGRQPGVHGRPDQQPDLGPEDLEDALVLARPAHDVLEVTGAGAETTGAAAAVPAVDAVVVAAVPPEAADVAAPWAAG